MSRKLVSLIQDNPRLSAKHKRVLEAYAARANNDGTNIFASKAKIGKKKSVSRSTIYHHTPDLVRAGILVHATSHTCKIDACNKGRTHYWGVQGKYTVVYNIDLAALENDETYLLLNQPKVPLPKQLNLFVQNRLKVDVAKLDATQSLRTTPVSLSEQIDSSVLTDGKLASKLASSADADFPVSRPSDVDQNQSDVLGFLPETTPTATPEPGCPQTTDEMYSDWCNTLECDLLHRISPNVTDAMVKEQFPICAKILSHFKSAPDDFKPTVAEMVLKWNHAHRSGKYASKDDKKLYIRTAKQFLAALESPSASLMNDYDTHDFTKCETCQNAGCGMHWNDFIQELVANQERDRLAAIEAERERAAEARRKVICPICDKRERGKMSLGGFTQVLSGGLMESRENVCDQCYDEKYEIQQKHANMRVREVLSPRPGYVNAKRQAEMDRLDAMEEDVPICKGCGQVSFHAKDCPAKAATA